MQITETSPRQREVHVGSTVSITDPSAGRDQSVTIVAPSEAKPTEGKLSVESPVGAALLGHRQGDLVEVHVPRGVRRLLIAGIA